MTPAPEEVSMNQRSAERDHRAKTVGIWIRVSTEDQARGESPEHHERRARAYAESKGWHVREVYHLEAVSGKSVIEHPEAKRMLGHIRSGHITGLIFSKLARLARNTRELLDFADIFREHDADLISLQESIDTSSPAGRLFYTMIAGMAQWEREEISERVAASVPVRAKLGKSLGGSGPYGYRWQDHQLVPSPGEAPVRRLMYELFLEHRRLRTVARLLNERGYRTRKGISFTGPTVKRILLDPSAKGVRRANYTRALSKGGKSVLKPESEWVLLPVDPIVPAEIWDQCHALLVERKVTGVVPARKARHLFTGLVRCTCGQRMYVPWRSPRYVCYGCRNKIRTNDLEAIFREQLRSFLVSPEDIGRHLEQADEGIRTREERLAALEAEAARVRGEIDKLFRLYQGDYLSPEAFRRQHDPLEARREALENEIPQLRGELDFLKIQCLSQDEVLAGAQDLYERWPTLTFEEQRAILEAVVRGITVGKEDVEVDLGYFPDASEIAAQRPRILAAARRRRARRTSAPRTSGGRPGA